jgi:hypothetical protein
MKKTTSTAIEAIFLHRSAKAATLFRPYSKNVKRVPKTRKIVPT